MNSPKGEQTIFAEALRLPREERAAYLAQVTSGNPELRHELESLLQSYAEGEFLEESAVPQLRSSLQITPPLTEKPGDRIGRYRLLEQIGEGGCGVVYVAEQMEPVCRRVALKIIKLGMDTRSVIARFEAERQALALMDHPNIAKVLDAGATETGRPYFVMELVRGMKITDFCDEKKLPTHERLDLFIQVCQAIQHAHQKGIIHRDIKPSNILVSVNDGVMVPKIIDFGIAKAASGQVLTDKTVHTAFEQFIGTPAYMSPEQAVITNADIDTRSDIYALGVLLYELLTGKTPFDPKELLAIGLDEMRRTIREQEPDRPSTRVSTLPGQELSTTAQRRGLEAPKLVTELRGDLDWIAMKCLEKDRARRYETANGLANDIQRHLNDEPVMARPPSRLYRLQRLVRRNKLAFTAAGAVAASLVIGLTLSTTLFFRERAARERADEQAANAQAANVRERAARERADEQAAIAQAVNDFLQWDLLLQAHGYWQAEAGFTPDPDLTVREAVERAAERIGDRFTEQPLLEAALRMTIGRALHGVGEYGEAEAQMLRAIEVRQEKLGPDHRATLKSMDELAWLYMTSGKLDEALPLCEKTLKRMQATLGPDHPNTLLSMTHMACAYERAGRLEEFHSLCEETLKRMQAKLGPDNVMTLQAMYNLATGYAEAGKLDQAVPLYEETLKRMKAKLVLGHPNTVSLMENLALAYQKAGKLDQAVTLFEETLTLVRTINGPDRLATLKVQGNLALAYAEAGKLDRAVPLFEETLKLMRTKPGPDDPITLRTMNNLGWAYVNAGEFDQALPLFEETLRLWKTAQGPDHLETLKAQRLLALAYQKAGQIAQALPLYEETLKLQKAGLGPDHPETLDTMNDQAIAYAETGELDQALPLFEETLKGRKAVLGLDHPDTLSAMNNLAEACRLAGDADSGKLAEAETLLLDSLAELNLRKINNLSTLGVSIGFCVETLLKQDKLAEAEQLFDEIEQFLMAPLQDQPANRRLLHSHGIVRARRGQWKEAAADLSRIRDRFPGDYWAWHELAPLLVASGQLELYREHCCMSVERFGNTGDPFVAERIARDCLFQPECGVDLEVLARMADTAAATTNHWATPWFQFVKGLSEYRQGRFADAVEWTHKTLAVSEPGKEGRDVEACMVLAMAYHHLNQMDEARAAFAKGVEIERTQMPSLESGDIGDTWIDWIMAHTLMREAEALIEGSPETESETK